MSLRNLARTITTVALVALGASCAKAGDADIEVDWTRTTPASGRVVDGAVEVDGGSGGEFVLVELQDPPVGGDGFEITGQVRYEGVVGTGYLQMWSTFADGGRYFSRTLADTGPLAAISGDSDWREFSLPFYLNGAEPPERLEVGVVLPGAGTVRVSSLSLGAIGGGNAGWWSDRAAGFIGAIGGSAMGILGAAVGALSSRGRARRFVLSVSVGAAALGVVLIAVCGLALAQGQPRAVTFTLGLSGGLLAVIFGSLIPRLRRIYAQAELRRMRALDTV